MIWLLGIAVLVAIGIALPELFSSGDGVNVREALQKMYERYGLLEAEAGKLRSDLVTANKQVAHTREKETEFVTKIFEQRKEIDQKTQEFTRAADNNKVLQERMFQMEKVASLMRQHHDKALIELKLLREQNDLLRANATLPVAAPVRRKKNNAATVS
jgi:hypothetical protein